MLFGDQYGSIHFDVLTSGIGTGFILKQSRQSKESIMVSDIPKTKTKPKPKPKPKKQTLKTIKRIMTMTMMMAMLVKVMMLVVVDIIQHLTMQVLPQMMRHN